MKLEKVLFINRGRAEMIQPRSDEAIISISNPDNPANLFPSWAPSRVLRLGFHDADENKRHVHSGEHQLYKIINCRLFDEDDAKKVLEFIGDKKDKVTTIYVHCDAGISRSAAIAKFIAGIYNLEFPDHYMLYNKLIYTTLTNTFNKMQYGE